MPTLGDSQAFTKVVDTGNELRKIAAELNTAQRDDASPDAKAKCIELQKRYNRARREFELATNAFSATRNGNGH